MWPLFESHSRFSPCVFLLRWSGGGIRVTGRVPVCGLVDLQSGDEHPLNPATATCNRKRGSLTGLNGHRPTGTRVCKLGAVALVTAVARRPGRGEIEEGIGNDR